jgi:hypothetical protein
MIDSRRAIEFGNVVVRITELLILLSLKFNLALVIKIQVLFPLNFTCQNR